MQIQYSFILIRWICLAIFCLVISTVVGQNLVLNPSFEDITFRCPHEIGQINACQNWISPTDGSTDYFNDCDTLIVNPTKNIYFGYQKPKTGHAMAGIFCLTTGYDYREYLEGELKLPLIADKTYFVSYYVNLASINKDTSKDYSHAAISNFGVYFSSLEIDSPATIYHLNISPQIENRNSNILKDTANWVQITGQYKAKGGEQFIIIGNFKIDVKTNAVSYFNNNVNSYYFIDDVSVIPIENVQFLKDTFFLCDGQNKIKLGGINDSVGNWNDSITRDSIIVQNPGKYWKIIDENGIIKVDTILVFRLDCTCRSYVPNTFTPNNNNINDTFIAVGSCPTSEVSMSIYNRWGECIFKSNDLNTGWTGEFRDLPCPEGVYLYQINLKYVDGTSELKKGKVMLIRNSQF